MKLIPKRLVVVATVACFVMLTAQTSQAGPWFDSLFRRQPPAYPVGAPVPVNGQVAAYSPGVYPSSGYVPPSYANLTGNQALGYGNYAYPPTYNAPLFAPGFPQTVAAQLPTAAYDSQWARTPVTYYRPVTAFDPRYGTTVTSLQPCTSYQYQAQRQPVIAPRPLLGDYGLQANRWPSITGPGYNPTGLANTAMYAPVAQPYQFIPNAGMQMTGQPSSVAPAGGMGVSSGMPASTLPLTTMPYNPPYMGQQNVGQQSFYGGQNYNGQVVSNPAYSSSFPGVVPTAAWMPSTACANGMCAQAWRMLPASDPTLAASATAPSGTAASATTIPYIPGATSVTPVGPPTYSAVPSPGYGNGNFAQPANPNSGYGPATSVPAAPGYANPGYANPYTNVNPYTAPPTGGPVLPNNQVMPPNSMMNRDPEADRRPGLNSFGWNNPGPTHSTSKAGDIPLNVQTLPMVAIDRQSNSKSKETPSNMSSPNGLLKPRDTMAMGDIPSSQPNPLSPSMLNGTQEIPQTLPPRGNVGMQPLSPPDDFDSNPRWTPTLLDPDDRVAMERIGRIRLQEDSESAVSAVALETKKSIRSSIQLVSGAETKMSEPVATGTIRFRPVMTLK